MPRRLRQVGSSVSQKYTLLPSSFTIYSLPIVYVFFFAIRFNNISMMIQFIMYNWAGALSSPVFV